MAGMTERIVEELSDDGASTTRRGFTLWLTGLSGAGKSTLGAAVQQVLASRGHDVSILDGDQIRARRRRSIGFSKEDRDAHVLRVGRLANRISRKGTVAIVAVISPYRAVRAEARRAHAGLFIEVFVDCPLEVLVRRDPKGLYARALRGEIQDFTGVSAPYEPPLDPELHLRTDCESIDASVVRIIAALESRGLINGTANRPLRPSSFAG
jgi:adenylylsulfate kinase